MDMSQTEPAERPSALHPNSMSIMSTMTAVRWPVGLAVLLGGLLSSCGPSMGNGFIGVDLSIAGKEYCREVSFPGGFRYPLRDSSGLQYPTPFQEYEFREGNALGEFLVAGSFDTRFSPRYTTSKFRLSLSSAKPTVAPIDDATWEQAAGKIMPLQRKSIFPERTMLVEDQAEFQGKVFPKTGPFWATPGDFATRLSPDQNWLVLQSTTRPGRGKVFFDVFSVVTGAKLVTLEGPLLAVWPEELINRTGWLAERYFVIPTGQDFGGSVVCEFSRSGSGARQ
jgi:hypothetical protein